MYTETVSIIVPAYNAEKTIKQLLVSIQELHYPRDLIEVIVVDNNSTDSTKSIVKQYSVTLLEENEIQSSYAARNIGISNATGGILAFTDADCIVHSDWLINAIELLNECDIVGGCVEVTTSNHPNITETYDRIAGFSKQGSQEMYVATGWCGTGNLIAKRKVFDAVGLFNRYLISGGDGEWGLRATQYGFKLRYCEKAIVYHPARKSFRALLKKQVRVGYGAGQRYSMAKPHWKMSYRLPLAWILEIARLLMWVRWVSIIVLRSYHKKEIGLRDLVKLAPIILLFGIATSYGRIKGQLKSSDS